MLAPLLSADIMNGVLADLQASDPKIAALTKSLCDAIGVWSRRSHPSSPVPAAAGRILAPKKAKKHTKTLIKSKLNQN